MNKKHRKAARKTVELYFAAWMNHDWTDILGQTQITWRATRKPEYVTQYFRDYCEPHDIARFCLGASRVVENYMIDVEVIATMGDGTTRRFYARVICEEAPYAPNENGTWGVNPASVFRYPPDNEEKTSE
jgi:hypothetical protein